MKQIRSLGYITISGEIEILSGLHIGDKADSFDRKVIDHPVIKNPVTYEPYIPGTYLRGRLRYQLEKKKRKLSGEMASGISKETSCGKDYPDSCFYAEESTGCRIFGNAQSDPERPLILIVHDALYTTQTREDIKNGRLPVTEAKTEILVDRITAHAFPRTIERVPAGARFDFCIVYKVQTDDSGQFDSDKGNAALKQEILDIIWALDEIEMHDCLGENTSRGLGKVKFQKNKIAIKNLISGESTELTIDYFKNYELNFTVLSIG